MDTSFTDERRRWSRWLLFGVGSATSALLAVLTAITLVARDITGTTAYSGLPMAASTLGTAAGASIVSTLMTRWGRRRALVGAYVVATLGAAICGTAVWVRSFPLLVVGAVTVGLGHSGSSLSRYVAAELHPVERRASAVGLMVWMGTVGAIIGPNLLAPLGWVTSSLGGPELLGAYVGAFFLFALPAVVYTLFLRSEPFDRVSAETQAQGAESSVAGALAGARAQVAIATLIVGHGIMVLIMTMTPLHVEGHGYRLAEIGWVMSGHQIGMYFFAPIVGRLVDELGELRVIVVGQGILLVAALIGARAVAESRPVVMGALFLLGLGWSFGFVAGSALLNRSLPERARMRVQGVVDSAIWFVAAMASASSSVLVARVGYVGLCLIGAALVALPWSLILWRRPWRMPEGARA